MTVEVAELVSRQVSDAAGHGSLLPPALPHSISARRLLETRPGDAAPLGLVDRPDTADFDVLWWNPVEASTLVAVGAPRSGVASLVDLLAVGLASRIDPLDVEVHAIEPLPQRRRAWELLPHTRRVVSTDDPVAVDRLIAEVESIVSGRRRATERDERAVLLVVGDLGRLRRWLPGGPDADSPGSEAGVMQRLARLADVGPDVGVHLVVLASRSAELGALADVRADRLVGELADVADAVRLGAPEGWDVAGRPGRCWSVARGQLVQLATPPRSVERVIADLLGSSLVHSSPDHRREAAVADAADAADAAVDERAP